VTRAAISIALLIMLVAACASPASLNKMNAWIATHVTIQHVDVAGRSCGQLLDGNIIQLDPSCGDVPWYFWHEVGHALDEQVWNYVRGDQKPGVEQTAQCVAEVVLGYSPNYSPADRADGYWDCPPDQVERTRQDMIAAGVW
jgi:hypothetical protein